MIDTDLAVQSLIDNKYGKREAREIIRLIVDSQKLRVAATPMDAAFLKSDSMAEDWMRRSRVDQLSMAILCVMLVSVIVWVTLTIEL